MAAVSFKISQIISRKKPHMLKIGLIRVTWDVQQEELFKFTLERARSLDKVTQTSEAILLFAAWSVSRKHAGDVELCAPTIDASHTKAVRTTFQKTRKLWHFTLNCCGYAHTDTVPTKKQKKNDKKKNSSVVARITKHPTQLGTHFMCTIIAETKSTAQQNFVRRTQNPNNTMHVSASERTMNKNWDSCPFARPMNNELSK